MTRAVEALGGVGVLRWIATLDMPADKAHPEVNPFIAALQAPLAAIGVRCDMAGRCHVLVR